MIISFRLVSPPLIAHSHQLLCQVLLGSLQPLLEEVDIRGCRRVLKPSREAERSAFLLWFHGRLVQEEVGIDVVDLKPNGKQMKSFKSDVLTRPC